MDPRVPCDLLATGDGVGRYLEGEDPLFPGRSSGPMSSLSYPGPIDPSPTLTAEGDMAPAILSKYS